MSRIGNNPRIVVVTRPTDYDELLWRHGTREQARFFLEMRGQDIAAAEEAHAKLQQSVGDVLRAIPTDWRRVRVVRSDLNRFVFEPRDVVVAVGQDGLVANVSKYLTGQHVIGINPDPKRYDGILVRHPSEATEELLQKTVRERAPLEVRTMVEAVTDDGQKLRALNEIFLGHRSHQSARYRLEFGETEERHSSSGVIVTTGTGATGWARSISRQRRDPVSLPDPTDPELAFFVREAFPSVFTGTGLAQGLVGQDQRLSVVSEMNVGGVLFGDGIEDDRIEFNWGIRAKVGIAPVSLNLVVQER